MVMLQWRPGRENGHVTEVTLMEKSYVRGSELVNLMERELSCYGGGQFNAGRMIVREVISFIEGEWSLRIWPV